MVDSRFPTLRSVDERKRRANPPEAIQSNAWKLIIPRYKGEGIHFTCNNIVIPTSQVGVSDVAFQTMQNIPHPGDKLSYNELACNIRLSVNMYEYEELLEWQYLGFLSSDLLEVAEDLFIILEDPNQLQIRKFKFTNAFPSGLGQLQLNTGDPDAAANFDVQFAFSYFFISRSLNDELHPLNGGPSDEEYIGEKHLVNGLNLDRGDRGFFNRQKNSISRLSNIPEVLRR